MKIVASLLTAAQRVTRLAADSVAAAEQTWWESFVDFVDSPAPYSPYSEYLLLLFVLWLMAHREAGKQDFGRQAQEVLDKKYEQGELTKEAYEKYRQELSMRVKR
ncbi:MAG: hypothetical protein WEB88_15910 [Gemmatimonadota bacterium]